MYDELIFVYKIKIVFFRKLNLMQKPIVSAKLLVFFVSILLSSCAVNRTIPTTQLDASIVPADFNPQKHVLLVVEIPRRNKPEEGNKKLTQQMEGLLKKYYPYTFEIVSMNDIGADNPKYADTSIYKYAIINNLKGVEHTTYTTVRTAGGGQHTLSPSATTTYISYYFFDRFANKKYGKSYESAWLKTSVQAFANTVKKAKNFCVKFSVILPQNNSEPLTVPLIVVNVLDSSGY